MQNQNLRNSFGNDEMRNSFGSQNMRNSLGNQTQRNFSGDVFASQKNKMDHFQDNQPVFNNAIRKQSLNESGMDFNQYAPLKSQLVKKEIVEDESFLEF